MKEKLLLLHGALGSKSQFTRILTKLGEFFEVYSFNFEGHGGRAFGHEFSIGLFTDNVIEFLREENISRINIFGYSMGGYVGLNAALKYPDRIGKVTTLGTKFKWDPESAEREVRMLNPDKIEKKVPHFANILKQEHQPQNWKNIVSMTADMMMSMGNGAKINDSDFRSIDQSIIIGIGSMDKMVSYEESEHVVSILPNAKLLTLGGLGHAIDEIEIQDLVDFITAN